MRNVVRKVCSVFLVLSMFLALTEQIAYAAELPGPSEEQVLPMGAIQETELCLAGEVEMVEAEEPLVMAGAPVYGSNGATISTNVGQHNYLWNWANPIYSYWFASPDNQFVRVEYVNGTIVVENYTKDYKLVSSREIPMELELFGGFFEGAEAYYFVFGQQNPKENDDKEVLRVVKYSKAWKRLGEAGIKGANTTTPFRASSLRMCESNGILYIRTGHEMYTSSDGLNHQANWTISVDENSMQILDSYHIVWNRSTGYVSHSFNQFIKASDDKIVTVDHGDAYPRSIMLGSYEITAKGLLDIANFSSVDILEFPGEIGENYTGATIGALEVSDSHYLVAGTSVAQDDDYYYNSTDNVYVICNPLDNFNDRAQFQQSAIKQIWLTNFAEGGEYSASTPYMVEVDKNTYVVIWEIYQGYFSTGKIQMAIIDGAGNKVGSTMEFTGRLSDCEPVYQNGQIVWYTTNSSVPFFHRFDVKKQNGKVSIEQLTYQITEVALNKTEETINVGDTLRLNVTVKPNNATNKDIIWSSSNSAVATVDANGLVTGVAAGTTTISAQSQDGSRKTVYCSVTVTQPVTSIVLDKAKETVDIYSWYVDLNATINPGNATDKRISWSSSDESVVSVAQYSNGSIYYNSISARVVGPGTATITAQAMDGSGVSASCVVTVVQPVTGVSLNKTYADMLVSDTFQLNAAVTPDNATDKRLSWSSSDKSVATVDANGLVRAVSPGTATITAQAMDGSGETAYCSVTVTQPVTGISLNTVYEDMFVSNTLQLNVSITPDNATDKRLSWSSSDESVAAVDANGLVRAFSPGTATITVQAMDESGVTAACTINVLDPVEGFVERLYLLVLGREADAAGKADWVNQLHTHISTGAKVAEGFFMSTELINKNLSDEEYVRLCYRTLLNREADSVGLADWVFRLENGFSRKYVFRGFAESAEFQEICDSYNVVRGNVELTEPRDQNEGVTQFVARCYTKALGRNFDINGLNDWCSRILTGQMTPQQVATDGFFHSQEFQGKGLDDTEYVKVLYRTFLGREYDELGLEDWLGRMAGGADRDAIMAGFAGSPEFGEIMAQYGL